MELLLQRPVTYNYTPCLKYVSYTYSLGGAQFFKLEECSFMPYTWNYQVIFGAPLVGQHVRHVMGEGFFFFTNQGNLQCN